MKKYILLGIVFLSINTLSAKVFGQTTPEDEIKATITASTTEKELDDLQKFLQEHQIELLIKKQNRNKNDEIIGIDIKLQRTHQQRQYSLFSNNPIPNLELGSIDGNLFINTPNNNSHIGISSSALTSRDEHQEATINSLLQQFGFDMELDFSDLASTMSFPGQSLDLQKLQELQEQMMQAFNSEEDHLEDFFQNQNAAVTPKNNLPKYSFIDKPDINKLIIINGEESTFEALDQLAQSDQLEAVDFLKPSTAISVYGTKAKDGAIIATSKK